MPIFDPDTRTTQTENDLVAPVRTDASGCKKNRDVGLARVSQFVGKPDQYLHRNHIRIFSYDREHHNEPAKGTPTGTRRLPPGTPPSDDKTNGVNDSSLDSTGSGTYTLDTTAKTAQFTIATCSSSEVAAGTVAVANYSLNSSGTTVTFDFHGTTGATGGSIALSKLAAQ